jgi:hypothetical protein
VSRLDSTTVQQDVDSVAVGEDFGGELGHAGIGREVGGVDCRFAAERLDCLFGLLVRLVALGAVRGYLVGWMGSCVPAQGGCLLLLLQAQWPWIDRFLVYHL